jgi:nitroreductase
MARIYNRGLDDFVATLGGATGESYLGAHIPGFERISESTDFLRQHLHRAPALLLPLMGGRTDGANLFFQASQWGSILQAVWSFMLALRVRGLGSCWTTGHLWREEEMAKLLGIPRQRHQQVGLFPLAYTQGSDFRPAWRRPVAEVIGWNGFGAARGRE